MTRQAALTEAERELHLRDLSRVDMARRSLLAATAATRHPLAVHGRIIDDVGRRNRLGNEDRLSEVLGKPSPPFPSGSCLEREAPGVATASAVVGARPYTPARHPLSDGPEVGGFPAGWR